MSQVENDDKSEIVVKKRGRKPGAKRTGYFYEKQEQAFIDYVKSDDKAFRDKIFKETLYPAFTKMIESIIRRYDLFTPSEDFTDTFCDTMSFLITKVNNYDVTKGKKAYSYCGTVCKNYLILKRTQYMKKRDKILSYDNIFNEANQDERHDTNESSKFSFYSELINSTIEQIQIMLSPENINNLTENEQKVGYALFEMLINWEDIFKRIESQKFNKTSVYFFIKETTMLSTKDVRDAMKKFKKLYFFNKQKLISD